MGSRFMEMDLMTMDLLDFWFIPNMSFLGKLTIQKLSIKISYLIRQVFHFFSLATDKEILEEQMRRLEARS